MKTTKPTISKDDGMMRRMVERLIIENRNSLNDPTTNEPYDVKGIADDVIDLIADQQRQLLDRLEAELPERKNYIDFEDEVTDKLDATYVGGINEVLADVHKVINDIREGLS